MRKLATFVATFALFALLATPADAKPMHEKTVKAGKSNVAHTNLWSDDGEASPWGRVKHNYMGETFDFILNAHGLDPETEYTVKSHGMTLATGMSDEDGNLHIKASWECTQDITGRINVREMDGNERVLWSDEDTHDVFMCESTE